MRVLLVASLLSAACVEAGYYKIRAPPPPPLPPGTIHYGPHPPSHYPSSQNHYPSSHKIYPPSQPHYPPPPPHYPPSQPHYPSPQSHYPPSQLHYPPTLNHIPPAHHHPGHHHHHHPPVHKGYHKTRPWDSRPPSVPPMFKPYSLNHPWKNPSTFRAPVVKENFLPPPPVAVTPGYTANLLREEEKGPIHTIPAPKLGPADRPAFQQHYKPQHYQPKPVLNILPNHIANHKYPPNQINHNHLTNQDNGYQVTEDPSTQGGGNSYFAPDPDPSIPAVKVPQETDPSSQPSNGQVPLDLYLQQQTEQQQQIQQQHLLQQQQLQIQQQQLQLQPQQAQQDTLTAQDLYNLLNYQPNLIPQSQLQQHVLQPNVQFYNQPVLVPQQQFNPQFQSFNYEEQTQQGAYGSDSFPSASMNLQVLQPEARKSEQEQVNENQVDRDDNKQRRTGEDLLNSSYYTSLPNKHAAEALATLAAAGSLSNADKPKEESDDVKLQKSIQIYDNKEEDSSEKSSEETESSQNRVPYGNKRPKRF